MTAVIITGKKRGGPRQMAAYLVEIGENETVTVRQVRCLAAKTVKDALAEMWVIADGSKAKDFLYHATINPRPGVKLTQAQWRQAIDLLEKNLNLVGHQRVVVEHVKNGRTHFHIVWNRVNPKTGRAKKLFFDRRICRATALQLEALFNLEPTPNKGKTVKRGEIERGKRTNIDPRKVKDDITAIWNKSTSGKDFITRLAKHSYILAKGDRNKFVIIDRAGSIHGLTRRIHGATAKTIKRGLADIDRASLPTIPEAKAMVRAVSADMRNQSPIQNQARPIHSLQDYAGVLGDTDVPQPTRKKKGDGEGKSDGSGGGMGNMLSAFKFSPSNNSSRQGRETQGSKPSVGSGTDRRRYSKWVAVERRQSRRPKGGFPLKPVLPSL